MQMLCPSCSVHGSPARVWRCGPLIALECATCHAIHPLFGVEGATAEPVPSDHLCSPPSSQPQAPLGPIQPIPVQPRLVQPRLDQSRPTAAGAIQTADVTDATDATDATAATASPAAHAQSPQRRCPRCAHHQSIDRGDACDRCGFAFANNRPGLMPWDLPPEGKAEAWAAAQTLWDSRATQADDDAILQHCLTHGLEEWAARQCRFFIADHPDDARAQALLDRLLNAMHARLLAHLSSDRSDLDARLSSTRRVITVLFTLIALALMTYLFSRYVFS